MRSLVYVKILLKITGIQQTLMFVGCPCGQERLKLKEARERDIAKCLKAHDEMNHPAGETLPMEQRVYRLKVLSHFYVQLFLLQS